MEEAERITSFSEGNAFLSNFYPCKITMGGTIYPTLEHAYQAGKTDSTLERAKIRACRTPGEAKRMGRTVTLIPDWDAIKVTFMKTLVWQKFSQNKDLRDQLIATGDAELIEGNKWNDVFWGAIKKNNDWIGYNFLGKILMEMREEVKQHRDGLDAWERDIKSKNEGSDANLPSVS